MNRIEHFNINSKVFRLITLDVVPEFLCINQNDPNCVVIGDAGDEFSYQNLNKAFQTLVKMETPVLFAMGKG